MHSDELTCKCIVQCLRSAEFIWGINHEMHCPVLKQFRNLEKRWQDQLAFETHYKIPMSDVAKRQSRLKGMKA